MEFGISSQIQGRKGTGGKVHRYVGGKEFVAEGHHLLNNPRHIPGIQHDQRFQCLDKRRRNGVSGDVEVIKGKSSEVPEVLDGIFDAFGLFELLKAF